MTNIHSGRLSDLLLVRVHGRTAAYLTASGPERDSIVAACRAEATVPDLAERILLRTIYSQASNRIAPLRELIQNALDASPRGRSIEIRSSMDGAEITVTDHGSGMTAIEMLTDLLVPFRSGKEDVDVAIGEHGIGFFSALEIAPRLEVKSRTSSGGNWLRVEPLGSGPPYADFRWTINPLSHDDNRLGTSVRLLLNERMSRSLLAAEVALAAAFVDPSLARIYVDGIVMNVARTRMRRVAKVAMVDPRLGSLGDLELWIGREGAGIAPQLTMTQRGLLVATRQEPFVAPELGLHRELMRAILAAGFGFTADLSLDVPLNKGRSGVMAHVANTVEAALITAFERFVLHDALYDRDLLRAVDHRLSSVLDRLLTIALSGQTLVRETSVQEAPPSSAPASKPPPGSGRRAQSPRPTVAAPEEVVRFADALLDTPSLRVTVLNDTHETSFSVLTLRHAFELYRDGRLRLVGEPLAMGKAYISLHDPLSDALWRRLTALDPAHNPGAGSAERRLRSMGLLMMPRVDRETILAHASSVVGIEAVASAMTILEGIDAAVSIAAEVPPSPISVHQDLYGPDEMAHTDGSGISVNLASGRVRALLLSVLRQDDIAAFGGLVDLVLHEKTHVSLASFVPHANAEHGASFYRRKDQLRRRLLEAVAKGHVGDPITWLRAARRGLSRIELPAPEVLAAAFRVEAA
jgi:Histidine kinase-, DNA gyrase B-, and HSP90-like ATPase